MTPQVKQRIEQIRRGEVPEGYKCSICGARIKNAAYITGNHFWCYKCGAEMK